MLILKNYFFWRTTRFCFRATLLCLIYINDLPNVLISICKMFAYDSSIFLNVCIWFVYFSKAFDKVKSQRDLNNDLSMISKYAFQWKMQFSPDPNEQANEVYFSRSTFTWDPKWTQTGLRFHIGLKFHFGVR